MSRGTLKAISPGRIADRAKADVRAWNARTGPPLKAGAIRSAREAAAIMGLSYGAFCGLEARTLDKLAAGMAPDGLEALDRDIRRLLGGDE
jgi:hypothetical protein